MNDKAAILQQISDQLDRLDDYGHLQMSVKKHRGYFSNIDIVKVTSHKFTDNDPNVTASTAMLSLLKGATESAKQLGKETHLGYSITIDKFGHANVMQVQDFKKI